MEEVLIFSVKIDQDEALKQSAELSKEISALVEQQKELTKNSEQNSVAYAENAALLRSLKKEQSDVNRQIDNSVKAFNSQNGSINQQRANLSLLTQQYNNLSKEERENANVGGKLQQQIKGLSDELKKNESAVGDNRRNVGNYKDGILEASKSLNLFGVDIGGLVDKLKNTKDSIDIAKSGFSGFNGVLKASVIGVVITLITGLIAAFTKFEPLADKLKATFAGINAVVDVFVERLTRIGRGLVEILSGNFSEGIDQIRESFDGMGSAMAGAAKEAFNLSEQLDALDDKMRAQIVTNAQAEQQVNKLILQSKNRTLSEQQRLKFLDEAGKIERDNFNQNKALQEEAFNLALDQAKLKTQLAREEILELLTNTERREELEKRIGTLKGEELDKLAQQQADIIRLESETINVEEKIANRRDALIEAETQKRQKALEERIKQEQQLEELYNKAFEDFDKKNKEQADKLQSDREKQYNDALTAINDFYKRQEADRTFALRNGALTEEEFAAQQLVAKQNQTAALIELDKQFYKSSTDNELAYAQATLAISKNKADEEKKINTARLEVEKQTVSGLIGITQQAQQLAGEQTQEGKALAIAGTTISTYQGATQAFTSLSAIPVVGPALGTIAAGLAIANGLANVKKIAETNAAAGGGTFYTKGPTMLLVGDNPNGREKVTVEPIGTRGKTTVNRNSNLVKMAGGGTLMTDGGAAFNEVTQAVNNQLNLSELIRQIPAPIVKVTDIDRVNNNRAKTAKVSGLR